MPKFFKSNNSLTFDINLGHPRAEGFQEVPGELGNQELWHSIQLTKQS